MEEKQLPDILHKHLNDEELKSEHQVLEHHMRDA